RFQSEHVESLALGVARDAAIDWCVIGIQPRAGLLEQIERIVREELPACILGCAGFGTLAVDPDLPRRTVAGDGLLLVAGDRVLAHSGEKIVGMIVLAHVMETESPIFALAKPPLRRAMSSILVAIGPIANRTV